MLFNSINFMVFFPIVIMVYFFISRKYRYLWLLVSSYYFYMCWNPKYILLIAASTVITWSSGVLIEKYRTEKKSLCKCILAVCFISNIGILVFFKYFDFILMNINSVLGKFGIALLEKPFDVVLPVGISFYIFQALSYNVDIFQGGGISAERNLLKYALFVSFFPQLVAGPIERSGNLLNQINDLPNKKLWDYERIANGLLLMVWGYFQKMVIADRVAVLVDTVFSSYYMFGSLELVAAAIGFAVQIYCDFASYSTIAIGASQVMGITLMENFQMPYFARSIKEFWHRWHISLSTWFRDYLYIPLGGSRCSKKRKYFNLMVTFLVSGLWHGANWTYVFWGGIHGLYQIVGAELAGVKNKLNKACKTKTNCISYKIGQAAVTFILVDFAWIFFRSNSLKDAFYYIERIFTRFNPWVLFDGTIYTWGLNRFEINVLLVAIVILILVDIIGYKKQMRIDTFLQSQCIWFRWGVVILWIVGIAVFGMYGPAYNAKQFIYFQF